MVIKISTSQTMSDSDGEHIKHAIEPMLTAANENIRLKKSVHMSDGFLKPVEFTAVNKGTHWQVHIHTIGIKT